MKKIITLYCCLFISILCISCSTPNPRNSSRLVAEQYLTHLAKTNIPNLEHLSSKQAKDYAILKKITTNQYFMQWLGASYRKGYKIKVHDFVNKATAFVQFPNEETQLKLQLVRERNTWKVNDVSFWNF